MLICLRQHRACVSEIGFYVKNFGEFVILSSKKGQNKTLVFYHKKWNYHVKLFFVVHSLKKNKEFFMKVSFMFYGNMCNNNSRMSSNSMLPKKYNIYNLGNYCLLSFMYSLLLNWLLVIFTILSTWAFIALWLFGLLY